MYKTYIKRPLGFLIALFALLLTGWLLALVALFLHFANRGAGAFFTQDRPGLHGRVFRVIKFKTMTDERDAEGRLLPDEQRLTPIGRIVRSLSIDELPQLINVLRGDMAFIGPRPWKVEYLPLYTPEQMRRHEVRPGISGWAQVNGRNAISFTERMKYDVYYVDHLTLWMDLRILCKTVLNVLRREGINEAGQATCEEFNGKN